MPRNIIERVNELGGIDAENPNSNPALAFYNRTGEIIDEGDYDADETEEQAPAIVGEIAGVVDNDDDDAIAADDADDDNAIAAVDADNDFAHDDGDNENVEIPGVPNEPEP